MADICTLCLKASGGALTRQLSCKHLFCTACSERIDQSKIPCPKCRLPLPVPTDNVYEIPIPLKESKKDDKDCLLYYDDVAEPGDKPTNGEEIDLSSCRLHHQETKFFCQSCTTAVCSECLLTIHKIGEHEITSFADFKKQTIYQYLNEIKNYEQEVSILECSVSASRELCKKDAYVLGEAVVLVHKEATRKLKLSEEKLLAELKVKDRETSDVLQCLDSRRKILLKDVTEVQALFQKALKQLETSGKLSLDDIGKMKDEIVNRCKELKDAQIPEGLCLRFEQLFTDVTLGKFTPSMSADAVDSYAQLRDSSREWFAKGKVEIGESEFDYANIVCMDDDWFVHVGNLYGSQNLTIKHYSLKTKQESRHQLIMEMEHYSWVLAKTAGNDQSILLASGDTVYIVSFRKKEIDFKQTLKVSFDIEAISWDEFGVDCYLLSRNLRNVHWLSRNGDVNFLCAFETSVQSAGSLNVTDRSVITLLDITPKCIHMREYSHTPFGKKVPLTQPLPNGWSEGHFSQRVMASMKNPEYHFILFSQDDLLAVGLYDRDFRFVKWVVHARAPADPNCLDMVVKNDNLVLLFDTGIWIYKIPKEMPM